MGRKKREAENFHEAENMALTSISFGLCAILTILICIPQLKEVTVYITIIWVSGQNSPNCTCNSSVNFSCKLGEDEEKFAMFFHCHVIL